jgi:hypothetical protein
MGLRSNVSIDGCIRKEIDLCLLFYLVTINCLSGGWMTTGVLLIPTIECHLHPRFSFPHGPRYAAISFAYEAIDFLVPSFSHDHRAILGHAMFNHHATAVVGNNLIHLALLPLPHAYAQAVRMAQTKPRVSRLDVDRLKQLEHTVRYIEVRKGCIYR